MPLYEYECSTCHKRTEKIQKFSDPEITICPHCGGPLERTITAPAFQFAGGGWYKDGYGNAKPPASVRRSLRHRLETGSPGCWRQQCSRSGSRTGGAGGTCRFYSRTRGRPHSGKVLTPRAGQCSNSIQFAQAESTPKTGR